MVLRGVFLCMGDIKCDVLVADNVGSVYILPPLTFFLPLTFLTFLSLTFLTLTLISSIFLNSLISSLVIFWMLAPQLLAILVLKLFHLSESTADGRIRFGKLVFFQGSFVSVLNIL